MASASSSASASSAAAASAPGGSGAAVAQAAPARTACLDDFVMLKTVGRGSFGKVMMVRKKDDGKVFAMKTLKKDMILRKN
jgi:serine/threonine protein kinase